MSEGHQRYLEVKLGSLLTQALDKHFFSSGKCVYQADSSHSILSDVCLSIITTVLVFVPLRFLHRRINEHQSTSIIRIPHHCLIIIGLCLRPQVYTWSR